MVDALESGVPLGQALPVPKVILHILGKLDAIVKMAIEYLIIRSLMVDFAATEA